MLKKKIVKFESGKIGSALIMTVVLTVLLSIVAVMFVMVARMDSASTSNIVNSKTLDNAAKSIIEIIGKELVFDTPGVALNAGLPNTPETQKYFEYQDYPDVNDAWLANIEPYKDTSNNYYWRQISDVTGYLKSRGFARQDVSVKPTGSNVVKEYPDIKIDDVTGKLEDTGVNANADADGDGIADSKWIELADMRSPKGKPVYAAVRVIDNCAMLNVNTAYMFDANSSNSSDRYKVDGTSQMQINLNGLLKGNPRDDIEKFHKARGGAVPDSETSWDNYDNDVIWKYDSVPGGSYLPFDISDELELRYRYCIDSRFAGRIETDVNAMPKTIRGRGYPDFGNLYDTNPDSLTDWEKRITEPDDAYADRRHLLTAYNFDRLIDPDGNKMLDIRSDRSAQELYNKLTGCIDPALTVPEQDKLSTDLAQIAANIVDYDDNDSIVSVVKDTQDYDFYGYEPPFMFISEIARFFNKDISNPTDSTIYKSYAIELYKNFNKNDYAFDDWQLTVDSKVIPLSNTDFNDQGGQYYVYVFNNEKLPPLPADYTDSPQDGAENVSQYVELSWPIFRIFDPCDGNSYPATEYKLYCGEKGGTLDLIYTGSNTKSGLGFLPEIGKTYQWYVVGSYSGLDSKIRETWEFTVGDPRPRGETVGKDFVLLQDRPILLIRKVGLTDIVVDSLAVPGGDFVDDTVGFKSYQRDMRWNVYLKGLWGWDISRPNAHTLGHWNSWDGGIVPEIPPWHNRFKTVGDAAMVFRESTYITNTPFIRDNVGKKDSEVRFDPYCPSMQNVFKYITGLNPANYVSNDASETRVRGRININTAPKFVIEQLPWVSKANREDLKIADAIVAYRDKTTIDGIDYSNRQTATGLPISEYEIREAPGFSSIGELMNVINGGIDGDSGKRDYDIRYCGIGSGQQYGFPDLTFDSMSMTDGAVDDLEEKELIFARISDLVTVRSDTFTAYILVRVGVDGPQKRFIAILDRTGVKTKDDKVKVAAFQQVPAAR